MSTPDVVNSIATVSREGFFERVSGPLVASQLASQQSLSISSRLLGGGFGPTVDFVSAALTRRQNFDSTRFQLTDDDRAFLERCLQEGRQVSWQIVHGRGRAVVEFPPGDFILRTRELLGPLFGTLVGMAGSVQGCALELARNGAEQKLVEDRRRN